MSPYELPSAPESGWLEGAWVHPSHQGRDVRSEVHDALLRRLPRVVREALYLGVLSSDQDRRAICDAEYEFLGAYCWHQFIRDAPPASRAKYDASRVSVRLLMAVDVDEAWTLLSQHPLHAKQQLVLPGALHMAGPPAS